MSELAEDDHRLDVRARADDPSELPLCRVDRLRRARVPADDDCPHRRRRSVPLTVAAEATVEYAQALIRPVVHHENARQRDLHLD